MKRRNVCALLGTYTAFTPLKKVGARTNNLQTQYRKVESRKVKQKKKKRKKRKKESNTQVNMANQKGRGYDSGPSPPKPRFIRSFVCYLFGG
jgi:hypothetical protein